MKRISEVEFKATMNGIEKLAVTVAGDGQNGKFVFEGHDKATEALKLHRAKDAYALIGKQWIPETTAK